MKHFLKKEDTIQRVVDLSHHKYYVWFQKIFIGMISPANTFSTCAQLGNKNCGSFVRYYSIEDLLDKTSLEPGISANDFLIFKVHLKTESIYQIEKQWEYKTWAILM